MRTMALLVLVYRGRACPGDVVELIFQATSGKVHPAVGRVATVLAQLEREGRLVQRRDDDHVLGLRRGRPRKFYALTPSGLREAVAFGQLWQPLIEAALGEASCGSSSTRA